MPMKPELINQLNANIAIAKKQELPFGLCLGKKPEGSVLVCHKTKDPEALGRQAKKEGETNKIAFGILTCKGKDLYLKCLGEPPSGLARQAREMLKAAGIAGNVKLLDADGNEIPEGGADGEAPPEGEAKPNGGAAPDPLAEKWGATKTKLEPAIVEAARSGADVEALKAAWKKAGAAAAAGDFAGALTQASEVVALIKQAGGSAAERKKWLEAESKVRPIVEEALASGVGDVKKIQAVWSMALGKAQASPPDYAAAMKLVGALVKAIGEARATAKQAKPAAAAPEMATAGAAGPQVARGKGGGPGSGVSGNAGVKEKPSGTGPTGPAAKGPDAPKGEAAPKPEAAGPGGSAAPSGPTAAPGPAKPADLKGSDAEKIKQADDRFDLIDKLIDAYAKVTPGSGETTPAAWTAEITRIKDVIKPMREGGAKVDSKKLDKTLKEQVALEQKIRSATAEKQEWKKALELFQVRLIPIDSHAQAAAPEVKPSIDAIKADRDKAIEKAKAHDFKGALADLAKLGKRCDEVEALADGFAHYSAILAQRQGLVNANLGVVTGVKAADELQKQIEDLLNKAATDATAGKFADAIKKLDQIPALHDKRDLTVTREAEYQACVGAMDPRIAAIDALPGDAKKSVSGKISKLKKDYGDAKFSKTKDYVVSMQKINVLGFVGAGGEMPGNLLATIEAETAAYTGYKAALGPFETQFNAFKAHKGRSGIEEFYLGMERDYEQAKSEAASAKFSTATALLTRTQARWAAQKTLADDCLVYLDKRKAVEKKIANERKTAPASVLKQADDLMAAAANKAQTQDFKGALANVEEAERRAADAKAAGDAQKELGKLKDDKKLAKIKKDFDAAFKVFTDMRAKVASKDAGGALAALIAKADVPAQKAKDEKAKPKPDFDAAKKNLDDAIALLEAALPKVMAAGPYQAHLAKVKAMVDTTLPPLNVDNCIKPRLDAAKTLVADAENLVKPEAYDFAGAEAKLTEATKLAEEALRDAPLWPPIKTDKATTKTAVDAIAAEPTVVPLMTARTTRLNQIMTDIDAKVVEPDFKGAQNKGKEGAGLLAPTQNDILTCKTILARKVSWYDNWLPTITGPAAAAGAAEFAKTNVKLATYQTLLNNAQFDAALNMLDEVSWGVQATDRVIKEHATYEPARVTADTKINAVKAVRNKAVETQLAELEKRYKSGVDLATAQKYKPAESIMKAIPADCDPLLPLAQAYKDYDDASKAARAKLDEALGHAQAAAIQPMLTRLSGKFDNAAKLGDKGDYAEAKKLMDEIVPAAADAINSANNSAKLQGVADALDGSDADAAPSADEIKKVKDIHAELSGKPEASAADAELKEAAAQLAIAEKAGTKPADAKAALKAAMEACRKADEAISGSHMLIEAANDAKAKIVELKTHAQKDYIATELKTLGDAVDGVIDLAGKGGQHVDNASKALELAMTQYHAAKKLADDQAAYIKKRAEPDVEPRLDVLEKHKHRYAIKENIDAIRAKLKTAADKAVDRKHEEAMKLLEDVRALGTSSLVLADMRENKPPSVDDVKSILKGPGGQAELDAMVAQLEPDAQRKVLRVAFEARFGCDLKNWSDAAQTTETADGALDGPNIKRFYEVMSDLPDAAVVGNDSMRTFSIIEAPGGGSFYSGDTKDVVMYEGDASISSAYSFGQEHEVGKVDKNCEPANKEPVSFFSWNTLHEVGHAVDDKSGFMDKNGAGAAYGGWVQYGRNVQSIAKKLAEKYKYEETYISQYLAHNANPAIPAVPEGGGAPSPEEWESRRIAVRAYIDMAATGNNPWSNNTIAKKLEIDGRVYQESYPNSWTSYEFAARSKGMTGYQFRAPGEWFSELYAAYHSGKLKSNHPAVGWLQGLGGPAGS